MENNIVKDILNPKAGTLTIVHFSPECISFNDITEIMNEYFTADELLLVDDFKLTHAQAAKRRHQAIADKESVVVLLPIVKQLLAKEKTMCRLYAVGDVNIIFDEGWFVTKFRGEVLNNFTLDLPTTVAGLSA